MKKDYVINDLEKLTDIFWNNVDAYRKLRRMPWASISGVSRPSARFKEKITPTFTTMIHIANSLQVPVENLLNPEFLGMEPRKTFVIRVGKMYLVSSHGGQYTFVEDFMEYQNYLMKFSTKEQAESIANDITDAEVELW